MSLANVVDDLRESPLRRRSLYEYPDLYEFVQSRAVDRDRHVDLLERYEPRETDRVVEFGCGTGPLLERVEGEYATVVGVERDEGMAAYARDRAASASSGWVAP